MIYLTLSESNSYKTLIPINKSSVYIINDNGKKTIL